MINMGFMATMKAQKAAALHSKGDIQAAKKLYQEAVDKGLDAPRFLLAYAALLIREGEYQKAKDLLVKTQKAPGISAEQKIQLFMDYAVCCYKLGDMARGLSLLEKQHRRQPTGMVYETLGYLYVEWYQPQNKPVAAAQPLPQENAEGAEGEEAAEAPAPKTQAELDAEWQAGIEKALAFIQESVDYDDEDAVCLDNMAQFYYRVLDDKATAKTWFDKAIAVKEGQIDTLWFLSRYDLDNGDKAAAIAKLEKALEGRFSPLNCCTKSSVEAEIARLKA